MYNTMFEERDKRILYSTAVVRQHNGARCRSSRRSTTNRMKKGFTLLECLLLTVLTLLLIGLAVPLILDRRQRGNDHELLWRGRMIAWEVFATGIPTYEMLLRTDMYKRADPEVFRTSTDLFRDMVRYGFMGEPDDHRSRRGSTASGFAMFGGGGVPELDSWDPDAFSSTYNAWCVVEGPDPADPERVPFLISRNVVLDRVGPGVVPQLSEDMPLGSRGWMFVTRAGVSYFFSTEISVRFWNTGTEYREILRP